MAKNGAETTLGLIFLVLNIFFFLISSCTCTSSTGNESELLISIKSSVHDPLNFLANWNLSLPFCHWKGIACDNNNNSSSHHVSKIELSGKNLSGKIPESIFWDFPYVETIDLSNNHLTGEISFDINSSCFSLRSLNLSNNNFTGSLPKLASILKLQVLDLSNNLLSGKIPEEIGLLSGLKFLDLGGNVLVGTIPKSISNVTGLEVLTLASNQLVGEIPRELGRLKSLKWIYLGYNNLSGGIPIEIGELTCLNHLDLVYNNLTGEIPSSLGNLTELQYLFLYLNKFTSPIPRSIFGLKKLISLDLSDNFLSGDIPELIIQLQNLEILHLFSNNFKGKIPNALSFLPHLQVLQLWSNDFFGEIPLHLGKHQNLTVLDLSTNNLTGKIPGTLCDSTQLFKLILFSNSLEGELPRNLSHCKSLKRVRIQNNRLSGELPPEFTQLPLVYFLDVSNNNLSGKISGNRRWEMSTELQMLNLARNNFFGDLPETFGSEKLENLDMSENSFSGEIPGSYGNLSELMQLKLSKNKLAGKIPEELCSCKKLVSLDLSQNQLSGLIPTSLSQMPVLGQLDLSNNQLSGEIPRNLGKVESLVEVNISHNHFHGNLPSTGAFLAINSSAVAGNRLCGGSTSTGLPPCRGGKTPAWWFFMTCLLSLVVVLAIVLYARRGKGLELIKRVENEDGIWEIQFFDSKFSKEINVEDIVSSMRDENVISGGRNEIFYKEKTIMSHMQFFSDLVPASVWAEVAELGRFRHPNIAKVIAICGSKNGGFLVFYEYIEGKSLSEVVKGLSWEQRRKIVLGIAKALRYLHGYRLRSFYVGSDLSPEKIIVDGKDEPRLRLSPPGMMCKDTKSFFVSSAYVAPETRETEEVTEKSDIYGFGLILFELLSGKSRDAEFGDHESIVEWAQYCYSECHLDVWVDPTFRGRAIMNNQNQIVETMNLALHCTACDPTARPTATDVVKTLDSIIRPSSCVLGLKCPSSTV